MLELKQLAEFFPDMTEGRLNRCMNRNLFFGSEDKINLRLPDLVCEFHTRLARPLDAVLAILRRRYQPPAPAAP